MIFSIYLKEIFLEKKQVQGKFKLFYVNLPIIGMNYQHCISLSIWI